MQVLQDAIKKTKYPFIFKNSLRASEIPLLKTFCPLLNTNFTFKHTGLHYRIHPVR